MKVCVVVCLAEGEDGRMVVEKTEKAYEFKTNTNVGKVGFVSTRLPHNAILLLTLVIILSL